MLIAGSVKEKTVRITVIYECFADEFAEGFIAGWEECMKYLQSLPLDEAANRILYHGTKIGDKSTFND